MLCSRDFFNKTKYNNETLEQLWLSVIGDSHDSICSCEQTFAHLLSCIFPLGHTDRDKTIQYILERDFKEKCRSGGVAGDAPGSSSIAKLEETPIEEKRKDLTEEEDLDQLLAAAAATAEEG